FSSRRRHTRFSRDWSSDVCSSDLWSCWTTVASSWKAPPRRRRPTPASSRPTWGRRMPPPEDDLLTLTDVTAFYGPVQVLEGVSRSEERRVGKEGRSRRAANTCKEM